MTLTELPNFTARPGTREPHHTGQVNTPLTQAASGATTTGWPTRACCRRAPGASSTCRRCSIRAWRPPGVHTLSVFAQYVPHRFKEGTLGHAARGGRGGRWWTRSPASAATCPGRSSAIEVLGPPDIERRVGLTGGHIFQGEILPAYMWDRRLTARTPMPGVFLCGAGTHPGGSVIGINGRNAAMEVLADGR